MRFVFSALAYFRKQDGFALVEVTIALIIMGIVMGVGLPSFLQYLKWQRVHETETRQEKILYSLASFVLQNGYLPLPAYSRETWERFGLSRETLNTPQDNRGLVPFKTLGLPERYAKDGFGRYFTYIGGDVGKVDVDASHKASFCTAPSPYTLHVSERLPGGQISDRPWARSQQDPTSVILISHGESGYGAHHGTQGRLQKMGPVGTPGPDKHMNAGDGLHIISRGHSKRPGDEFDDIVRWVTRDNLMAFYGHSPCYREETTHVEYRDL